MKYRILLDTTWEGLQQEVNHALARGWTLQGGISTTSHSWHNEREGYWETTYEYAQAMCEPEGKTRE